jgi:hypothetical protein
MAYNVKTYQSVYRLGRQRAYSLRLAPDSETAIGAGLDQMESEGWTLREVVPHESQDQTLFIFHMPN